MTGFLWDQYLFLIFLRVLQSLSEGGRSPLGLTKGNPTKKWVCLFVWVLPPLGAASWTDFFRGAVSLLCSWQIGVVLGLGASHRWMELLGWTWKLAGTSLDLHGDRVVMLLFSADSGCLKYLRS